MDKGLEEARKRYEWGRSTLRSYNRDGYCIAMVQVVTFLGTMPPKDKDGKPVPAAPKPKAVPDKQDHNDATRVIPLKARTETSRRPAVRK